MMMMVGSFLVGGKLLYHLCFIFVFCLWGGMICGKILASRNFFFFFFFWSPGSGRRKGRKNRNPRFFHALHLSICFSATLLFYLFSPLWFPELYFQPMLPSWLSCFLGGEWSGNWQESLFSRSAFLFKNTPPPEVQLAETNIKLSQSHLAVQEWNGWFVGVVGRENFPSPARTHVLKTEGLESSAAQSRRSRHHQGHLSRRRMRPPPLERRIIII